MVISREMVRQLYEYEPDPHSCTKSSTVPCNIYWSVREKLYQILEPYEISLYELMIEAHILALAVSANITAEDVYEDVWNRIKRKAKLLLLTDLGEDKND